MIYRKALLAALLCAVVSLFSSVMAAGSQMLTAPAEALAVGGSSCSDFMDGFVVAMGISTLLGCVWCAAGAVAAKAIGLFC